MARGHSSTPAERVQWVAELVAHAGEYGVVTKLSRASGVSRQTLYTWRAIGQQALAAAFRPTAEVAVVTPELERAILTLWAVGHASLRGIQECVRVLHQQAISLATISLILAEAQQRALQWFTTHAPSTVRTLALDELYGPQRDGAYLTIVDAHSWAVWATAGPLPVDADSWILLLWEAQAAGLDWDTTVSDGERAITDACKTLKPDLTPQRDVWHVLHRCAQAQARLDRRVAHLRAQARTVARQAERVAAGQQPRGRKPQADVATHAAQIETATRVAEGLRFLGRELRRLVEVVVVDRRGVLDSAQRAVELDTLLALLAELCGSAPSEMQAELKPLHTHVRLALPDLVAFAAKLDDVQRATASVLGGAGLALLAWAWLRRRILGPSTPDLVRSVPPGWRMAATAVLTAWSRTVRASSAAENWHSLLRPHLAVHRRLTPGMLALLAVWHNHRVFTRGAHRGFSPLQLSGMADAPTDWLVALGYPAATTADITRFPSTQLALAVAA